MELSEYHWRRQQCLQTLEVPMMSEVKANFGEDLANVYFEECPDALKPLVGLEPPLEGAGDDLWTSPSDLLIGKVCLKPPFTSKHMKALTHNGILEIGRDVEQKYWNEMLLEKEKALAEQKEMMEYVFRKEMKTIEQRVREEEQALCACMLEQLNCEFEIRLQNELKQLEHEMIEKSNQLLEEQREGIEKEWKEKLDNAVSATVKAMTAQFFEELQYQLQELIEHYENILKKEQIKHKFVLETERQRYKEVLKQLKHYLECKNIANMMYVLCMERKKCLQERKAAEDVYLEQINELQKDIVNKKAEITKLNQDFVEAEKKSQIREQCVVEVLRQFQKFINFALRATPTQAEFLLNVEKMMLFELTQSISGDNKCIPPSILPWNLSQSSSSTSSTKQSSIIVKDHHDCFNETDYSSEVSLLSNDVLPAMTYNKNLYVREDFRNMISQGLELKPDSMLWNKDVDNLMKILKASVEKEEKEEALVCDKASKTKNGPEETVSLTGSPATCRSQYSRRSSVHFKMHDKERVSLKDDKAGMQPSVRSDNNMSRSALARRSSVKQGGNVLEEVDFSAVGKEERRKSILAAKNSLELHRESFYNKNKISGDQVSKQKDEIPEGHLKDSRRHSEVEEQEMVDIVKEQNVSPTGSYNVKEEYFEVTVKDSLPKHRKSLKPGDMKVPAKFSDYCATDSPQRSASGIYSVPSPVDVAKLPSKDSLVYQKESFVNKTMATELSKLSLARDSVILTQERKKSISDPKSDRCSLERVLSKARASKISMARDSLEIVKGSQKSLTEASLKKSMSSKISMHTDSLEILKKVSRTSATNGGGQSVRSDKLPSKESVEILDGLISVPEKHPSSITKVDEEMGSKAVRMSHIEIVKIEGDKHTSGVYFNPEAVILEDASLLSTDSPIKIYTPAREEAPKVPKETKKAVRKSPPKKPNVAKVVGDREAKEHLQAPKEFTLHRMASMMDIFRKHPSLVKIFTAGTR